MLGPCYVHLADFLFIYKALAAHSWRLSCHKWLSLC